MKEPFKPYLPTLLDHVGDLTGDWSYGADVKWRDVIEFDGPKSAYCFGGLYETLTDFGVKPEGSPFAECGVFNEAEAWFNFHRQLLIYTENAKQVAWRRMPALIGDPKFGSMHVTARLAVYR